MYGKIEISGKIELLTGMHIGASDSFAAIGAIDTPVIKDPISGSSHHSRKQFKG